MRYFLHLAYNGSGFQGWQIQKNAPSVQQALQTALLHILGSQTELTGCGRTDSGVHASDFYAHFDHAEMSTKECERLKERLNRYFDHNILIYKVYRMRDGAHARFDAISRTYKYCVSSRKQPFGNEFCLFYPWDLDVEAMNRAAESLIGTHDFTSFSKLHTQVNNNICSVRLALWERVDDKLVFTICANRFLRNMVRAVVGTLLLVGRGKLSQEEFLQIVNAKDRCSAGVSVAAKALFLFKVEYPQELFLQ